jgi:thiol-disulfide isomerase/thioredoxin
MWDSLSSSEVTAMSKLLRPALLCSALITSLSLAGDMKPAPDFNLDQYNAGKKLALSELKGQVVLINFWASWCIPCKEEMPLLDQMYRKYKPMGFTLLGVNVEPESTKAEALLQQKPVAFPVLFDRQSQVSKLYNVTSMPSSVLIDRNGNVRYLHRGYKPGDENTYLDQIRALMRE